MTIKHITAMNKDIKICVIGLGYVGLPLARLFLALIHISEATRPY